MPDFEIVPGTHRCPYCGDMYWVDNVQPDSPPPLFPEHEMNLPCYHNQVVECSGDVNFCSICGTELHFIASGRETLRQWQVTLLKEMGL